ncbi:hypothetical protein E2C01_067876 [Portunus trituberculatus]|uniref:Uncharacterized protein n=1 Tax=Portunus trituberculatus TaxID=210409 RepID=A0A5B7HU82_PORTR|nr:hypothetical protein [Portunus trituberculatus]
MLVNKHDILIDHEIRKRRNVAGKTKSESTVEDILTVMMNLDSKGITTSFVAKDLNRLPKYDPKDIDPYGNHQLIMALQEWVQRLEDNISEAKAEIFCNQDGLRRVKTHKMKLRLSSQIYWLVVMWYAGVTSYNRRLSGGDMNNSS